MVISAHALREMACKTGTHVYVPLSLCPEDFIAKFKQTYNRDDVKGVKVIGTVTGNKRNRSWEISIDNYTRSYFGKRVIEEIKDEDELPLQWLSMIRDDDEEPFDCEIYEDIEEDRLETGHEVAADDYTSSRDNLQEDDWQAVSDFEDQRKLDLIKEGKTWRQENFHLRQRVYCSEPVNFFLKCFPMDVLNPVLEQMTVRGRIKYGPSFPVVDWGLFLLWLGVWIHMCIFNLPDRSMYWQDGDPSSLMPTFYYDSVISYSQFARLCALLHLPTPEGANSEEERWIAWLKSFTDLWQSEFVAGTFLTVDETMVFWTGLGPAHLTYLPRKPTPLGIMFKTLCDSKTGVLMHAEKVDGAERDRLKKWYREFKATTACTLRLTEPWHGTRRVVIADSWFGSCRTAEELWEVGLYSIMSVKTGTKGFPKDVIKKRVQKRDDLHCLTVKTRMNGGEEVPFYAVGHFDKAPLHLIATCGSTKQAEDTVRDRRYFTEGAVERERYVLKQPEITALYRQNFPAVDKFNRTAVGPGSVVDVWGTKSQETRFFAATLSFAETNAYKLFKNFACNVPNKDRMTRLQWKQALSSSLIHNRWRSSSQPERPIQSYDHSDVKRVNCKGSVNCSRCRMETKWKCLCAVNICRPGNGRPCYFEHIMEATRGN